jgi:hypothetical protein
MPRRSEAERRALVRARASAIRQRRRAAALGATALAILLLAVGVAIGGNGGGTEGSLRAASVAPTSTVVEETTTSADVSATTNPVTSSASPTFPATTAPPPTGTRSTTTTVASRAAVVAAPRPGAVEPPASLAEVWPPSRDPARVYVSARGVSDGHVSRMTIDWGDGSQALNFDYPPSPCQGHEAADTNHRYAVPGAYTVRLIVTSVRCDGTGAQTASAQVLVTYPSSPPA